MKLYFIDSAGLAFQRLEQGQAVLYCTRMKNIAIPDLTEKQGKVYLRKALKDKQIACSEESDKEAACSRLNLQEADWGRMIQLIRDRELLNNGVKT